MKYPTPGSRKPAGTGIPKSWHAVSVVPKAAGCEAVKMLRGQRFLSAAAPRLPLKDCGTPQTCACAYKHYDDRRGAPRRKEELTGLRQQKRGTGERRTRHDRRSEDADG